MAGAKVGIICPNGAGFVIAQWATWLTRSAAVPLNVEDSEKDLETCLHKADCDVVVATEATADKINAICKRGNKELIRLDAGWMTEKSKIEFDNTDVAGYNGQSSSSSPALIVFTNKGRKVEFSHREIEAQSAAVANAWHLDSNSSLLHCLPLNHPYGLITALSAPLSAGGKVVMMSRFDTVKVWSHLLGIAINAKSAPPAKINLFPTLPGHIFRLLDRYKTVFGSKKAREFVKYAVKKRGLKATVSSCGPISGSLRKGWKEATGQDITNCYTIAEAGTVLTGSTNSNKKTFLMTTGPDMEAVPGVRTRVVRFKRDTKSVEILDENARSSNAVKGQLLIKSDGSSSGSGWIDTGSSVKMNKGKFEILS